MAIKYLFSENIMPYLVPKINEINFYYHINMCDWPIKHSHKDYWEITVVASGEIINRTDKGGELHKTGSVFVSSTQDEHCLLSHGGNPSRYINLLVKESYVKKMVGALFGGDDPLNEFRFARASVSGAKIAEIERILINIDYSLPQFYAAHDDIAAAVYLLLASSLRLAKSEHALQMPPWQLKLNRLAQDYSLLNLNVNALCSELGYSRTQLNHLFNRHYGISPHDYIVNYKFNYAATLLKTTNLTIADVAYKIGYSNVLQFYNVFKKIYGVTPALFRNSDE